MVYLQQRSYIQKSTNVMDKDNRKNEANEIYFRGRKEALFKGRGQSSNSNKLF